MRRSIAVVIVGLASFALAAVASGTRVPAVGAHVDTVGETTATWSGTWRLQPDPRGDIPFVFGRRALTLTQQGSVVRGRLGFYIGADKGFGGGYCYSNRGGVLRGVARGRNLTAEFVWPAGDGVPKMIARIRATLSLDGRRMHMRGKTTSGQCEPIAIYLNLTATRIRGPGG